MGLKAHKEIDGFIPKPKLNADNSIYQGRFTCPAVQWTDSVEDRIATFTVTAEQLADAAENGLLWTDQAVQRGIQPGVTPLPPRELSLADGYPDTKSYIFDTVKADDIVEKLLHGGKLFLNPWSGI